MKLEIKDILNKHKGIPAIVIGHGPSLNDYRNRLKELKEKGFIIFGCNEWYNFHPEVIPDYYVLANNIYSMKRQMNIINTFKSTVIYADVVDLTDRNWVAQNIQCDYLPYDQHHFGNIPCYIKICCHHLISGRNTLQEELMAFTGYDSFYGAGDTVALHMLATGVLMGCNPVYMTGVDLSYRLGYAHHERPLDDPTDCTNLPSEMEGNMDRHITNFTTIVKSAEKIGTRIINLNKNSIFNMVPIGDLEL